MEHNAEKLQEILNRIMQGIVSIITSALSYAFNSNRTKWTKMQMSLLYLHFVHQIINCVHYYSILRFITSEGIWLIDQSINSEGIFGFGIFSGKEQKLQKKLFQWPKLSGTKFQWQSNTTEWLHVHISLYLFIYLQNPSRVRR